MKKEKINFGGVTSEPGSGGGGSHVPPGDYLLKVVSVEKKWKDNDKNNAPYFRWQFQVVKPEKFKGKKVSDITSLKPDALFNLRNLIWATLDKNVSGKTVNFDPESLIGKRVGATIEDDERGEGKKAKIYSSVADYFPAKDFGKSDDEEDEDDDDDDDEEEEESDDDDDDDDETLDDVDVEDV